MNSVIGKSIFQRVNGGFGLPFMNQNQKLRGVLVDKDGQSIKIDVGNKRLMELKLNREIDSKPGDVVVIDKRDILESRQVKTVNSPLKREEVGVYSKILHSFNLPIKDELLGGLKALDVQGMQLSKENLLNLMMSKNQLDTICDSLDYDKAVELMEKDIDIEKDPINKVATSLEELKEIGKSFSVTKFLKNQFNMSTEEAEKVAKELFGSKMGKDYTDIIKALDKAGIDITKKNIERVNDIFSKLHQLRDLGEDTIIGSIKNKIDASIDNLVKLKNSVTRGIVAVDEKLSQYTSRLYEASSHTSKGVSERDLLLMEEEIKDILRKDGHSTSKENIQLAKELIKGQMPVTSENIEKINSIKAAIGELITNLDHQKVSELIKQNVIIEKETVTDIVELLKKLEETDKALALKNFSSEEKEGIAEVLNRLKSLKSIKDEDLVSLLKRNVDFKISDLDKLVLTNGKLFNDVELQDTKLMATYTATIEMSQALSDIKDINFNSIAFHLNNKFDLTLEQLAKSNRGFITNVLTEGSNSLVSKEELASLRGTQNTEVIRALINQRMPVNQFFVDKLQHIKNQLTFIKEGVTASIVAKSVDNQIALTKLDIDKTVSYIKEYNGTDKVAALQEALPLMATNRQHLLAMMMKNAMPISLKGVKDIAMLLNNKQNITQDIKELLELFDGDKKEGIETEAASKLQTTLKELAVGNKQGKLNADKIYEELSKAIKLLESSSGQLNKEQRQAIENKIEKLKDTLEVQQQLNNNDTCFQMPVLMNEELKNLQIYVMNKKKNTKKIDPQNMSILLNMETNSVGNLNIYVAVSNKNVMLKVGLDKPEFKRVIEPQAKVLIDLMKDIGYEVKEVGFRVNDEQTMLDMLNHTEHEESIMKHYIDIKI